MSERINISMVSRRERQVGRVAHRPPHLIRFSLAGSNARRFRSTKEYLNHAQWLITDQTMTPANCVCKYCSGSKTAIPTPRLPTKKGEKEPRQSNERVPPPPRMAGSNSVSIRTSQLPPPDLRPRLGVTVPSIPLRDSDLSRAADAKVGECEGYRVSEIVWVHLEKPIVDPTSSARRIDKWPAVIEEVKFQANVAPQPAPPSAAAASTDPRRAKQTNGTASTGPSSTTTTTSSDQALSNFSLQGRVTQIRVYDVILMGSPMDQGRVPESRLRPFMSETVDAEVASTSFGEASDHSWVGGQTAGFPPKMYILEPLPEGISGASFAQKVAVLGYGMTVCNFLRCRYQVTNGFQLPDKTPAAPTIPTPHPSAFGSVTQPQASTSAAGNSDGAEVRPSVADRRSALNDETFRPQKKTGPPPLYDAGKFYQGMIFGLEKVWVGDMARLNVHDRQVKNIMTALQSAGALARKSDVGDQAPVRGSFVMRLRAIMRNDAKEVKAIGSVYEIMTKKAFDKMKAVEHGIWDAQDDQGYGSPPMPVGKSSSFAFPALGLLTSAGRELPRTPAIPPEFVLSPIHVEGHEVHLDVTHLAGRMYTSLSRVTDDEQTYSLCGDGASIKVKDHMDSTDINMVRLSLTGALPGWVKPIGVEEEWKDTQEELWIKCHDAARGEIQKVFKETLAEDHGDDAVPNGTNGTDRSTAQPNGAHEANETILAVARLAASASPTSPSNEPGPSNGNGKSTPKTNGSTKRKSPSSRTQDGTPSSNKKTAIQTPNVADKPDITAKARNTKRQSYEPSPSQNKKQKNGTQEVNSAHSSSIKATSSVVGIAAGSPSASSSTTALPTPSVTNAGSPAPAAAVNAGGIPQAQPTLPAGWIMKQSRNGHGHYYAHPSTKRTRWDPPTEDDC